jgi:hypothetical protein
MLLIQECADYNREQYEKYPATVIGTAAKTQTAKGVK